MKLFSNVPKWLVWSCQAYFGMLFLFSGTVKGIDVMGTALKIEEYLGAFNLTNWTVLATPLAYCLILSEFFLGLSIFSGLYRKVTSGISLLFMFPLTLLTLYIAIANPVADCGCFGDAIKIDNSTTFWKNIVLLFCSIVLFSSPLKMYRLVPDKLSLWVLLGGFIASGFGFISLSQHVPVIDFRPYKVGSDLYTLTQAGKDGIYDYRFVYKKDGKERVFTIDEIDDIDSTWIYVRDETIELMPPVDPKGLDLVLLDSNGTPATPELAKEGVNAFLFVTSNLSKIEKKVVDKIVDAIHSIGQDITLVMSESFEEIDSGKYRDIVVPFDHVLYLDKSASLTLVRSNPSAVVVIGDGKIARKASISDFIRFTQSPIFSSDPYGVQTDLNRGRNLLLGSMTIGFVLLLILGGYFRHSHKL